MKFLLVALLAVPAFAVTVKNCPDTLKVSLSKFQVKSVEELTKEARANYYDDGMVARILQARARLAKSLAVLAGDLKLLSAENATCKYGSYEVNDMKAKFFTRNGRDLLRVATSQSGGHLGTYVNVESYDTDGLEVSKTAGVVYEVSDSDGEFSNVIDLGRATDVKVE